MQVLVRPRMTPGGGVRLLAIAAVLLSAIATWALSRHPSEVEQHRRHFAELQHQVEIARQTSAGRRTDRGRVMRLRAQARAASGAQRDAYDAEASTIESGLAWGDRAGVRAALLTGPMLRFIGTAEIRGLVPASVNENGCVGCHLTIATSGFESYPAPFRTHSNLAAYVGAQSPHPPSRVRCVSCHEGDGHAASFSAAGHSTLEAGARTAARTWSDPHASNAMLPVSRTEAGCMTCHLGERYQPGANALNEALVTFERGGCYGCHTIPGMEQTAKRGPDLRRIRGKLAPEWVRHWLADPRAVKPSTWMPSFWGSDRALTADDRAAIDSVVAYLFASSETYTPETSSVPEGDPARGRTIVESVGCLGCHVVGESARDATSVRRTFGQPLQSIGGKTTRAWMVDWLRNPARFSPGTRMPNLRLTTAEAVDAAAYLETLTGPAVPAMGAPIDADDLYRQVLRRYDAAVRSETLQLTGDQLQAATGRVVINALGCFNCHEIRGFEGVKKIAAMRQREVWTEADVLALFERSEPGGPAAPARREDDKAHPGATYRFGPQERGRLALALSAVAGNRSETHALTTPWQMTKVTGRTFAHERNCVGCHEVEGTGGDFVKLVAEPTLGPPLLTPEGSRVQLEWLGGFLRQPRTIRPWLSVRMPTFPLSDDEIGRVGNYLRAIAPANPQPSTRPAGATAAVGKELFDLLKCQQCHVLAEIPKDQPTSNLAPDLRLAQERLQPEWIDAWLRNPSAILSGTRMPTFWPDFPKSFYPPLDGDGARQVRAIREHLLTLR
jgi:cytochrome c2